MAIIELVSNTSSSITLRLADLDTDWAQGIRETRWSLYYENFDLVEIKDGATLANGASSGGKVTFSNLPSDTSFIAICNVYFNGTLLASVQEYVGTAEGDSGGSESDFYITRIALGNVSGERVSTQVLDDWYETICWSMDFQNSGTATFTLLCKYRYVVYLSDSSSFNYDAGEPTSYLVRKKGETAGVSGIKVSFTYDVKANTTYYVYICLSVDYTDQNATLTITPPPEVSFAWSNAMAKGLPTNGVSYTEWNDFCDAIIAKKGSAYSNLLEAQKMSGADKEITAVRFNTVRAVIDYGLVLDIEEKTAGESTVIAEEFITLAENIN